jgi:AcrR family transcriptional regulator
MSVVELATPAPTHEQRIIDAALRCICRWGLAKTTLDDVAREAGCSRATVYRLFPGGKDGLMETVARTEIERFFAGVAARMAPTPAHNAAHNASVNNADDSLENLLVNGITEAGARLHEHKALQYLLAHEPEAVLPRLAFHEMDQVLGAAAAFAAPYLTRWLPHDDALRAAEWVARLVVSYAITPAQHLSIDDEGSVRALVRSFVLPGLQPHN